jgi:hypothetical protein
MVAGLDIRILPSIFPVSNIIDGDGKLSSLDTLCESCPITSESGESATHRPNFLYLKFVVYLFHIVFLFMGILNVYNEK